MQYHVLGKYNMKLVQDQLRNNLYYDAWDALSQVSPIIKDALLVSFDEHLISIAFFRPIREQVATQRHTMGIKP